MRGPVPSGRSRDLERRWPVAPCPAEVGGVGIPRAAAAVPARSFPPAACWAALTFGSGRKQGVAWFSLRFTALTRPSGGRPLFCGSAAGSWLQPCSGET